MMAYNQHTMAQRRSDFLNIILPFLINAGHKKQKMLDLFENGQVRVQWGNDFNNFTSYLTNTHGGPTCAVDNLVHSVWKGATIPNRPVMSCYIDKKGIGPIKSIAITDLYTLANGLKMYGNTQKNPYNGQTFTTLQFSHHSLSNNIWGFGIK